MRRARALAILLALATSVSGCCGGKEGGRTPTFRPVGETDPVSPSAVASASTGAPPPPPPDRPRTIARRVGEQRVDPRGPQFATPQLLSTHFKKHGEAMGFRTEEEYLAAAQALVVRKDVETFPRRADILYFRSETGEFAVTNERRVLRTYFHPDSPERYWERQKAGNGRDDDAEIEVRKRLRR